MKDRMENSRILSACRRITSFLLVLCILLPMVPAAYSAESGSGNYDALVGCTAEPNFAVWTYLVISDDPSIEMESGQEITAEEFGTPGTLLVEEVHWDPESLALWLKVGAGEGTTLPEKLRISPWVFQNYTDVYEDEDWESYSADALLLTQLEATEPSESTAPAESTEPGEPAESTEATEPSESTEPTDSTEPAEPTEPTVPVVPVEPEEPVNMVWDQGVMVGHDYVQLTGLTVKSAQAPTASFISRAVAYDLTPATEAGSYTGYAEVSIPVPEGWDTGKLFGFVVEADGSLIVIPGLVTSQGAFRFPVPHFSEVGLLEATALSDLQNRIITFGRIQDENVFDLPGTLGEEGRFVSDDGAVQYVINQLTLDRGDYTYVSLMGLDVTPATEILIGDASVIVIVNPLENTVKKLLTGGTTASAELAPLYDVGISGNFDIDYEITSGSEYLTLTGNTITAVTGATGAATVTAQIKHPTSGNVVGTVTYAVTVNTLEVTDVKTVLVPANGTTVLYDVSGDLDTTMLDTTLAQASLSDTTLTITGQQVTGNTSVVVGDVLYQIYVSVDHPKNDTSKSLYINVGQIENTTVYFSVNGGELQRVTTPVLLFDQTYSDGFNVMFFSAPDAGYVTSQMGATGTTEGQFYCLSNGTRYDGSDSDAWPLKDRDAQTFPSDANSDEWKKTDEEVRHGFRWALLQGNMNLDQMRDLFTRALALGCDGVTTFTKNDENNGIDTTISFLAEKLPSFKKTIVKITRDGNVLKTFDETNPYNPVTDDPLEIGDTVTYRFETEVFSTNITYAFTISDPGIGYEKKFNVDKKAGVFPYEIDYVIGKTGDDIDQKKIDLYANGQFTNTATLSYTYTSSVAVGETTTTATSSATCRISSIVTWVDNFGTVHQVKNVNQGETLPTVEDPVKTGYEFKGWDYNITGLTPSGDSYTVDYGAESSLTIPGTFAPIRYDLTYALDGGTLPEGVDNPQQYIYTDVLTLPTPTRAGYTFEGWLTTAADGIWAANATYPAGTVLVNRYGNVTLTAQWKPILYTVTWVDEDGNVLETDENVIYGTNPTYDGQEPSKEGNYVFTGWTPELSPVTGDVTYTAVFAPQYTITFDANGGSEVASITAKAGEAVTLPTSTRTNYTLAGWWYDKNGNNTVDNGETYAPGTQFTMPNENVTMTAQWVLEQLNIPAMVGINMQFYKSGDSLYYTFPENEPTIVELEAARAYIDVKDGYKWKVQDDGWYKTLPGIAADYIDPAIFTTQGYEEKTGVCGLFDPTGEINRELLSFEDADYTGIAQAWIDAIDTYLAGHFTNVNINWSELSRKASDYEVIPYVIKKHVNASLNKVAWHIDVIIVPVARYKVTYNLNLEEGYSDTAPVDDNAYGKGYQANVAGFHNVARSDNANYVAKFLGWEAKDEQGNAVKIENNKITMPASNVTLTAQWSYPVDYTVQHQKKDPSTGEYQLAETEQKIGYIGDLAQITEKTYTGYRMVSVTPEDKKITEDDQFFVVKYDPIQYKVIFHSNDGANQTKEQIFTYDVAQDLSPYSFASPGFKFLGWAETPDGEKKYDDQENVKNLADTQDAVVNLYALYDAITLTIAQTGLKGNESALYRVAGNGVDMIVELQAGGYVTIEQIPAGTYTVTELTGWTWKYGDVAPRQVTVTADGSNRVDFAFTANGKNWLGEEGTKENTFA